MNRTVHLGDFRKNWGGWHTCRGVYQHSQSHPIKLSNSLEVNLWIEFDRFRQLNEINLAQK